MYHVKLRNKLFWIFLSLFFMQQGSIILAASFHHHPPSTVSAEMSCHHSMNHTVSQNCSTSKISDHQCCHTSCHCSVCHCTPFALMANASIHSDFIFSSHTHDLYAFLLPKMHSVSLFRPPISS